MNTFVDRKVQERQCNKDGVRTTWKCVSICIDEYSSHFTLLLTSTLLYGNAINSEFNSIADIPWLSQLLFSTELWVCALSDWGRLYQRRLA